MLKLTVHGLSNKIENPKTIGLLFARKLITENSEVLAYVSPAYIQILYIFVDQMKKKKTIIYISQKILFVVNIGFVYIGYSSDEGKFQFYLSTLEHMFVCLIEPFLPWSFFFVF